MGVSKLVNTWCWKRLKKLFGGLLIFLLCSLELYSILKTLLSDYADYYTLVAWVLLPDVRVAFAKSLNHDLTNINELYVYGIK